ncbi:hypothetical protein COO60DRAFT_1549705 [Scenedesmus sp. NREL 46B-D3]|nr:hypothetical protein COO60DRAFT_1549705 [Scenedesmus sp. NREL 46B-D3]
MVCGLQPICTFGLEVAVLCLCQQMLIVPAQHPSCLLNETSSWGLCAGFAFVSGCLRPLRSVANSISRFAEAAGVGSATTVAAHIAQQAWWRPFRCSSSTWLREN